MASETKTKQTDVSVADFIAQVPDPQKRADAEVLVEMMTELSGEPAKMWGPSIVGFGFYHYKYESGHEGDMCRIGFSPRKAALTLYVDNQLPGFTEKLQRLGKHTVSKACIYIKRLSDIDMKVLREIITASLETTPKS